MPQRTFNVPGIRLSGSASDATIGARCNAAKFPQSFISGFLIEPTRWPEWVDHSRPYDVLADLYVNDAGSGVDKTVFLGLYRTNVPASGTVTNNALTDLVTIPGSIAAGTTLRTLIHSGSNDYTYAAHVFDSDTLTGFQLQRLGTSGSDDWAHDLYVAMTLTIVAYVRCQKLCCP